MKYEHRGFYFLRTPVLPLDELYRVCDAKRSAADVEKFMQQVYADDFMQKSLFVASESLYLELEKFFAGTLSAREKTKTLHTLFKYWVRMSSRSTPFGLSSASGTGRISDKTEITLAPRREHREKTTVDFSYLNQLGRFLGADPAVRHQLQCFPNPSLYAFGDKYRYTEYQEVQQDRVYFVSTVEASVHLDKVLAAARGGKTIAQLVRVLQGKNATAAEAAGYIHELLDNQVLVSELEPNLTGEHYADKLKNVIERGGLPAGVVDKLRSIFSHLEAGKSLADYQEGKRTFNELIPGFADRSIVLTNLSLATKANSLKAGTVEKIQGQVLELWNLVHESNSLELALFKNKFLEKYERKEVPLCQVLDEDTGIGYGGDGTGGLLDPLISGLAFEEVQPAREARVPKGQNDEWKKEKYLKAVARNQFEITIDEADLQKLAPRQSPLPDSFYIMGQLLKEEAGQPENAFRFLLKRSAGPSGLTFLGRFCHDDGLLGQQARAFAAEEEALHPDCIFAEIVHLQKPRNGNIIHRPVLRPYEIPYVGRSSVPPENQIEVDDLRVRIENGTVVLRSARLGKRVIPRLTSAHNYLHGLPMYRFLCDLQAQNQRGSLVWSWGVLENSPFLPRVRYKNLILERARWNLDTAVMEEFGGLPAHADAGSQEWRDALVKALGRLKTARYITVSKGDTELFFDLENEVCLQILADLLARTKTLRLWEFLATPRNAVVASEEGVFNNEIIIPFIRGWAATGADRVAAGGRTAVPPPAKEAASESLYLPTPDDLWVYAKVYCGVGLSDQVLLNDIWAVAQALRKEKTITRWFFIRYRDPEPHLRLRFQVDGPDQWTKTVRLLNGKLKPLIAANLVDKVQLDTYKREVERYGADAIAPTEEWFHQDSEGVLQLLALIQEQGPDARWGIGMQSVDRLLDDFGLNQLQKYNLVHMLFDNLYREFGDNKDLRVQMDHRYRGRLREIKRRLGETKPEPDGVGEVLRKRSGKMRRVVSVLKALNADGNPLVAPHLVASYVHMHCNRLFVTNQRKCELVLYYFLLKYYRSAIAIHAEARREGHPQ